jgi:hypothetical protein
MYHSYLSALAIGKTMCQAHHPPVTQTTEGEKMACRVIAFPVLVACGVCGRGCSEDDLGGCFTCDTRFCRNCHECECDKQDAALLSRLKELNHRPKFLLRLVESVRERAVAYLRFSLE